MIKQNGIKGIESEEKYYKYLSSCLQKKQFEEIENLMGNSINLDFFLDPRKIPNRFQIISDLLINCIQTLNLGEIFNILRFVNKYNLVDIDLTNEELEIIENIKKDQLLIANLTDLFGKISNSFLRYIRMGMPLNLLNYYKNSLSEYPFYSDNSYGINSILDYLNEYNTYGLNVKLLGNIEKFCRSFKKNVKNEEKDFIEFRFAEKNHLVSPKILSKFLSIIFHNKEYKFYNLSMVVLYGIGPQGFGFTFSTPKDEVVEICSDINQNKAVIVKYKRFLLEQFISRLNKELSTLNVPDLVINKLGTYLLKLLEPKNLISYYQKDDILHKLKSFFDFNQDIKGKIQNLIPGISRSITKILRPIKMIDQFKVRMDLIAENKLRSEDIAKLTSLKEKSNYDVLSERFFLQYIVEWFHELYLKEQSK
ncbi:MAG: hypothetical protein ACFFBH_03815 [Promethearchaeota archaeon]